MVITEAPPKGSSRVGRRRRQHVEAGLGLGLGERQLRGLVGTGRPRGGVTLAAERQAAAAHAESFVDRSCLSTVAPAGGVKSNALAAGASYEIDVKPTESTGWHLPLAVDLGLQRYEGLAVDRHRGRAEHGVGRRGRQHEGVGRPAGDLLLTRDGDGRVGRHLLEELRDRGDRIARHGGVVVLPADASPEAAPAGWAGSVYSVAVFVIDE